MLTEIAAGSTERGTQVQTQRQPDAVKWLLMTANRLIGGGDDRQVQATETWTQLAGTLEHRGNKSRPSDTDGGQRAGWHKGRLK